MSESLSDYLLDELSEAERAGFKDGLLEDEAAAAEVNRLAPLIGCLAALPAELWERAVPLAERTPRRRRTRSRPVGWPSRQRLLAILAPAAAILLAAVLVIGGLARPRPGPTVALGPLAGAPSGARATATLVGSDHVTLNVARLLPNARDGYYELWLMTSPTRLVSVARFRVPASGRLRLDLRLPAPAHAYRYFDVTLQRVGDGGAISGDSVLRAATPN